MKSVIDIVLILWCAALTLGLLVCLRQMTLLGIRAAAQQVSKPPPEMSLNQELTSQSFWDRLPGASFLPLPKSVIFLFISPTCHTCRVVAAEAIRSGLPGYKTVFIAGGTATEFVWLNELLSVSNNCEDPPIWYEPSAEVVADLLGVSQVPTPHLVLVHNSRVAAWSTVSSWGEFTNEVAETVQRQERIDQELEAVTVTTRTSAEDSL